jgi:hypothetical protein
VTPNVAKEVPEVSHGVHLVPCENQAGAIFFWPVAVPDPMKPNVWHTTALTALEFARAEWIRLVPRRDKGFYDTMRTEAELVPPKFADPPEKLLSLALQRRGITSTDHDLIRRLKTGK